MNKAYIVVGAGSGLTPQMIEEARVLASKKGKELVIVENREQLPRVLEIPFVAKPKITEIFLEDHKCNNKIGSRNHKKNLYHKPAKYF